MSRGWTIFGFIVLILVVLIAIYYYNKSDASQKITKSISADGEEKILTFRLPTSMDTEVFGPKYWNGFHTLASEVPCSICRNDAESLMVFAHDLVNIKTEKKLWNPENFSKWQKFVCDIKVDEQ